MVEVCLMNKQVEYGTQTALLVREAFAMKHSLFKFVSSRLH